ncbi:MAG: glycosyltransferase [Desulfobacteraceae bacterium]|nr:glycosyltransferase [Desulfobacteraceae bacterium]
MRILFISKYPPIQGGISAKTYWLAQGLAERGIETHVVTNGNCVESEYRIEDTPPAAPSNLHIHFVDSDIPWHIPFSDLHVPRLLDKALQVTRENQIDLIDTGYLIPYGIVGYLLSEITGIPYVLRHGGSDIEKFLREGIFNDLLKKVIQKAAAVITDSHRRELFQSFNSSLHMAPRYIPDERSFKPSISPHGTPTFAYIGKINYYWRYKSLHRIADIFSELKGDYRLIFVAQGKGFEDFSEFVSGYGLRGFEFRQFVHPANMPGLLNEIDFLICFTKDNPIKDFMNIFSEALWSGVRVLTDEAMDLNIYTEYIKLTSETQIVNLPIEDVGATRSKIIGIIRGWEGPSRYNNKLKYDFNRYLDANLEMYRGI